MFCRQCEQALQGIACTKNGVCGKTGEVSDLQDLLIHVLKDLAPYAAKAREKGINLQEVDRFTAEALFSTLTNVNFSADRSEELIRKCVVLKDGLKAEVGADGETSEFVPAADLSGLIEQGALVAYVPGNDTNKDINSLKFTLLFGLKGVAAYTNHAYILGKEDTVIYDFFYEAFIAMTNEDIGLDEMVALALKCGEINIKAMAILDEGNTGTFGTPTPVAVPLGQKAGKAILISGHDLLDLKDILEQTMGKGINVYTHGEMLPAHGYPELKKHSHFYGHYGTAWQNQRQEFAAFPGAILMTTNCLQSPTDEYADNIFTTGLVGMDGMAHVSGRDYTAVIEKALSLPGFAADTENGQVMTGFAADAVLSVADKIIEGVKSGAISRFFLVAGCDGTSSKRSYYSEFVAKTPKDSIILTLGCGKFRFFDKDLGDIDGIPRLLDIGQCNDAYSAVRIATALAEAFDCGLNELPLSFILSWYEQKAVAILLSLLHLGIKNIRLGPSLPAFISPNVLQVLVDNFNIMPISTPDEDLAAIMAPAEVEEDAETA